MDENEVASLIYIRCRHCGSGILALILNNPLGVSSVGLVTDLSPEEVLKYRLEADIAENDVLDFWQLLQKTDSMLELVS